MEERKKRLTSSRFGKIVKKQISRKVGPLVRNIVFSTFLGNPYTSYGIASETTTIKEYVQFKGKEGVPVNVSSAGLTIDNNKNKYLAASPDGIVQ